MGSCSRPRTPTKKLLTVLKPSNERTRTSRKKLLTSPMGSAKAENLSTSSKKPSEVWNKSETNFKLLSKKPKALLRSKRLRSFDSPLRCPKTNRTLNDESLRKKKKSITPDETANELSSPCKLVWIPNPNLELKPFELKRSSKVTSTTLKSNSDTPTDKLLKPPSRSRSCRLA